MLNYIIKRHFFLILILASISCKKDKVQLAPEGPAFTDPAMNYIDLTGKSVAMDQSLTLDLDGNKKVDLLFFTERHSFDLNTKSADVFLVLGSSSCILAANLSTETTPNLKKGDFISETDLPQHEWHPALEFMLMRYVTTGTQKYWEGSWKDQDHQYLPVVLTIQAQKHLGWVELFADTKNSKLVFYRAAISKEPQTRIRAGY